MSILIVLHGFALVGHAQGRAFVKRSSYGERDYAFGQLMLRLRRTIGLRQAGLADLLGVSRRAVGEWEAGGSYPKADRLKELIVLAVQQRAFPAGREEEEVRALWQAAHQKVLLDEPWLQGLLGQQHPRLALVAPGPGKETSAREQAIAQPALGRRVDWGDALAVPTFYGREEELVTLSQWVLQERCRVVSVLGLGGIGKSALAVSLMHQVSEHFQLVLSRSLRDAPACEGLLEECLQVLAPHPLREVPASLEERLSLLLEHLRPTRVLLVLHNLHSLLSNANVRGHLRPGLEGYARLLRRGGGTGGQRCPPPPPRGEPPPLPAPH